MLTPQQRSNIVGAETLALFVAVGVAGLTDSAIAWKLVAILAACAAFGFWVMLDFIHDAADTRKPAAFDAAELSTEIDRMNGFWITPADEDGAPSGRPTYYPLGPS